MHKLIEAAGRRSTGLAAGVILTGGMVGGVLLAPGAAYATTSATITSTTTATTIHIHQLLFGGRSVGALRTSGLSTSAGLT